MIWCIKTYIIAYVKTHKKNNSLSIMSNLQPNCCLKFDFQKVDQYEGGKWLGFHRFPTRVLFWFCFQLHLGSFFCSLQLFVVMIRLCHVRSHELMWSWGYGQCCPQQQWWRHLWMLVGDILNRQWKILHTHAVLATSVEIGKTRSYEIHKPKLCRQSVSPHFRVGVNFQGNIYWERCFSLPIVTYTIHRLQQTQLGTLYLSYCLSWKIGGHLEFCIWSLGCIKTATYTLKNGSTPWKYVKCMYHISSYHN